MWDKFIIPKKKFEYARLIRSVFSLSQKTRAEYHHEPCMICILSWRTMGFALLPYQSPELERLPSDSVWRNGSCWLYLRAKLVTAIPIPTFWARGTDLPLKS